MSHDQQEHKKESITQNTRERRGRGEEEKETHREITDDKEQTKLPFNNNGAATNIALIAFLIDTKETYTCKKHTLIAT